MDYNTIFWKTKAVQRNAQIKELKKRINEKTQSRNSWKQKYKEKKAEAEKYKKEITLIKKKIEKIVSI
jgi:peptidoglycan hydrolase CwlO-like protein